MNTKMIKVKKTHLFLISYHTSKFETICLKNILFIYFFFGTAWRGGRRSAERRLTQHLNLGYMGHVSGSRIGHGDGLCESRK